MLMYDPIFEDGSVPLWVLGEKVERWVAAQEREHF